MATETTTCEVCHEFVVSVDSVHWRHARSGSVYCASGDGAVATPKLPRMTVTVVTPKLVTLRELHNNTPEVMQEMRPS